MTEAALERERQVRSLRAAGHGVHAICRELGIREGVVYTIFHRDDDPHRAASLLGLYTCDGCGREARAPAGAESITCPHCDALAWAPMSQAEVLRRLNRAVARLELEAKA